MLSFEEQHAILKHVWSEPKTMAQIEFMEQYPSLSRQIEEQVGRGAMTQFASGGGWPDPNREIELVRYHEPDWDWWEPRHDQPWRRQAARNAAFDAERRK